MTTPFGTLGSSRSPSQWALLHAGIEFIPKRDREIMWERAGGLSIDQLAEKFGIPDVEVERSILRTSRTLAAWERNACKWATRYVAREPMAQAPGAAPERGSGRTNETVEG
jgi:hypothetical protein